MSTITKEQAQKIIEAADEVITALAGTNEDVHHESDSMLRLWDDLNDSYAPPEVVRELARIALASLEAERVGCNACGGNGSVDIDHGEMGIEHIECPKCYTAPPAPVSVPECFKRLLHHAYGMTMGHDWNKGTMAGHHRDKLCRAVEECRAAMLQGAEHVTTAYKLQEGWVACSERMPEIGVDVLACTISPIGGFEEIETAQWHGGMKGEHPVFITSADAIEPTHWMSLPAAPQQEVKP